MHLKRVKATLRWISSCLSYRQIGGQQHWDLFVEIFVLTMEKVEQIVIVLSYHAKIFDKGHTSGSGLKTVG